MWALKLDDPSPPGEDDIVRASQSFYANFDKVVGHKNYVWCGGRYLGGALTFNFIKSYDL